ncbi:MAG: (2Fe-2S) ferredoxin domain-containing protein [Flavobacteriaceae bacterium]|nr:(2Fe-2S) ferredoxin domain-containing protein [Flavobacteriaceae bacterium]
MGKNIAKSTITFEFCDGGSCRKAKSEIAVREARAHLRNEGFWDSTHTIRTRCNGRCEDAPTWIVQPGNFWYKNVTPEKAIEIVASHTNENTPIDEYLLYKDGWDEIDSDNERTIKPVMFKQKNDSEFGEVLVARAPASDQYLYPLFKKLFEAPEGLKILLPNSEEQYVFSSHNVNYTDTFDVNINGAETNFTLAIGPITKAMENDVSEEIKSRKVGVVEVIWNQENDDYIAHVRLKNRKGKFLLLISIPLGDAYSWEYILETYLNMDSNKPKIVTTLEQ